MRAGHLFLSTLTIENAMEVCQIVDLKPECYDEYVDAHTRVPVETELKIVGLSNIKVNSWRSPDNSTVRLVMSAKWTPTSEGELFEDAMKRYMSLPGVSEWEEWMDRLKVPLPGCNTPSWMMCDCIYNGTW